MFMSRIFSSMLLTTIFMLLFAGAGDVIKERSHAGEIPIPDVICQAGEDEDLRFRSMFSSTSGFWEVLTVPLITFYNIHGRYPVDVEEFLQSGLLLIWPADIVTGEPLKIVKHVNPVKDDIGKIAYIRESDHKAYFAAVNYSPKDNAYSVSKLPHSDDYVDHVSSKFAQAYAEYTNDSILKLRFIQHMVGIFSMTSQRASHNARQHGESTLNIEDSLKGCFFWIEDNIKPGFMSASPDIPVFFEWGYGRLHGEPVIFYERTTSFFHKLEDNPHRDPMIKHVRKLSKELSLGRQDREQAWDQISDITHFYSTKKLLEGTLDLPSSVVISIDDILEN